MGEKPQLSKKAKEKLLTVILDKYVSRKLSNKQNNGQSGPHTINQGGDCS